MTPDASLDHTDLVPAATTADEGWHRARRWVDDATRFHQCTVACQVMAGFELLSLREAHGITHGGNRRSSPNDSVLKPKWPELVKQHLGIGDDTARNWMAMAESAKPRIKKLGGAEAFAAILEQPCTTWGADQCSAVQATVQRLCDGKTQLDFMRELGLVKAKPKPQTSAELGNGTELTTEQFIELKRNEVRTAILGLFDHTIFADELWKLADDDSLRSLVTFFEREDTKIRAWLKLPPGKRAQHEIETKLLQS